MPGWLDEKLDAIKKAEYAKLTEADKAFVVALAKRRVAGDRAIGAADSQIVADLATKAGV